MNEKLLKEANQKALSYITRRHFLLDCVAGMGSIALGSLLAGCGSSIAGTGAAPSLIDPANPMAPKIPHFAPRAKSVIYLHMAGAPSQLELFDYKPELHKLHNKPCPPPCWKGKSSLLSAVYLRCWGLRPNSGNTAKAAPGYRITCLIFHRW
ncbi:DUF1501 domain-containing protein [Anseongella ginsenosidimutans]|uniref:DUF1501 domain-containing protein n=1 Tax=Anseongella ginsenosidimutans TaxID=496056 RepID=UPI0021CEDE2E|nr:DUF1501 domain-containing protein [Anseongella ginsenosidimutans]